MTGGPRARSPAGTSGARAAGSRASSWRRLQQKPVGCGQWRCTVAAASLGIFITAADTPTKAPAETPTVVLPALGQPSCPCVADAHEVTS